MKKDNDNASTHREEFDEFAESYNSIISQQTKFFNEDNDYFASYKVALARKLSKEDPESILDYGCGVGNNIKHLCTMFPKSKVYGFDVSTVSIEKAATENPKATFTHDIDCLEAKFDLIFVATVFHHIPDSEQQQNMDKIFSLAKTGARLFVFEHNPFNPVTRHIFNTCPLDKNAKMLKASSIRKMMINSGFQETKVVYTLFFPKQLSVLRPLENLLFHVPLGGQYLVTGVKQ